MRVPFNTRCRSRRVSGPRRPPLPLGDVAEGQPQPLALNADDHQAHARPRVEPALEQSAVPVARGASLEEAQSADQRGAA